MRGFISKVAMKTYQVVGANLESLSEVISWGNPWILRISLANVLAKSTAVLELTESSTECVIFVNLSSHPPETGRSVIKSIEMNCQGAYRGLRGKGSP